MFPTVTVISVQERVGRGQTYTPSSLYNQIDLDKSPVSSLYLVPTVLPP